MAITFLPGVPVDHVLKRLGDAGGKEIESGKFESLESSAALAANAFGWFIERPHLMPPFPSLEYIGTPELVDVEYCARFPWSGGRHPWLDAVVETTTHIVGVESKRFEPYRDRKAVSLSAAYDRPVWGKGMQPFERLRDLLRTGEIRFTYLDAAQLVKHAFGLVTEGRRRERKPVLLYLFAEPQPSTVRNFSQSFPLHRAEIATFRELVNGAEVAFGACSYREWLARWAGANAELTAHMNRVLAQFCP